MSGCDISLLGLLFTNTLLAWMVHRLRTVLHVRTTLLFEAFNLLHQSLKVHSLHAEHFDSRRQYQEINNYLFKHQPEDSDAT